MVWPEQKNIGRWGRKYRAYFRTYKCEVYNAFQSDGSLDERVAQIDQQADELFERLVAQIAARQGITEQLKADDQMAWVNAMNHVRSISEETVLSDLIYC